MNQYNINRYGDKIVPCSVCNRDTQDLKESMVTVCIDCLKIDFQRKMPIITENPLGESYGLQG